MAKPNILLRSRIKKARTLLETNQLPQAAAVLEQVVRSERRDADVWRMLGIIAGRQDNHSLAADYFGKALELRPTDIQSLYNLGIALRNSGDVEAALSSFRRVVEQQPDFSDACACLAHVYMTLGRLEESTEAFRKSLVFQPGNAELHSNLGSVLQARGLLDEAVTCYRKALEINPDLPSYDSFGSALTAQGDFQAALVAYREGLRRQPRNARVHSNLLLTLNYMPDVTPEEIFKEHCNWGRYHGMPVQTPVLHGNPRDPDRHLRIGYLSPDFRTHSVAYFIEPLLAAHHREYVEVFCYSLVPRPDQTTERLRTLTDQWREIHDLSDPQIVELIQKDRIDILVDLAGHTAHNRLTVFARKPAPVQVTWLGYPNTTGLSAIDYRLTDAIADPAGEELYYTEKLLRLPDCFLCYQPPANAPPVEAHSGVWLRYLRFLQ
jgi:predicted O-linked N-acetylglucosamine transferase (SPINDLY family)